MVLIGSLFCSLKVKSIKIVLYLSQLDQVRVLLVRCWEVGSTHTGGRLRSNMPVRDQFIDKCFTIGCSLRSFYLSFTFRLNLHSRAVTGSGLRKYRIDSSILLKPTHLFKCTYMGYTPSISYKVMVCENQQLITKRQLFDKETKNCMWFKGFPCKTRHLSMY